MTRLMSRLLAATLLLAFTSSSFAAPLTAREIMQKAKDRDTGDNAVMEMQLVLIDAKGNQRERLLRSYSRDVPGKPEDSQSIMFFLEPASVKDTGFLTYDYDASNKDDDQWLYLPALKKVKRIAATDKSGSFMGSDFTYADMSTPSLDDYKYELMKETVVNGDKVWQIQATPASEKEIERTGYTKSVIFVRQDNFVVIRSVNWVKKGDKLKYMEVKKLEQIEGVWTGTEIVMTTKDGQNTDHASIMRMSKVRYNQKLDDDLFSERRLSKGP